MESVRQAPLVLDSRPAPRTEERTGEQLFRELFDLFYLRIVHFFDRRGFGAEEARDLAQDTFLRAYASIDSVRSLGSARAWLFSVAMNVYRNQLRRTAAGKRTGEETSFAAADGSEAGSAGAARAGEAAAGEGDSLRALISRERDELLRKALGELPPRMRQAVFLRLDGDLTYREIAVIMQVSVETIKAQFLQARQRLRETLAGHFTGIDL
jgi:RNA polymerase sigma-70 factor (ECF subfamily)